MQKIKTIILLLTIMCLVIGCCGCDTFGSDDIDSITYESYDPPKNIDPLLAKSTTERMIVRAAFEPLCMLQSDGGVTMGSAKSYSVDKSGLVYTFVLPENAKWSDESQLTAHDYVFNLQRAVNPETLAECADDLKKIKNADSIIAGKMTPESLGVTATNDHTLTITLSQKDDNLLRTLCNEAGMPCNEKFFYECKGKYGLSRKTTLTNGGYYIGRWVTEQGGETMTLIRSDYYIGNHKPSAKIVYINVTDDEQLISRLGKSEVDVAPISSENVSSAKNAGAGIIKQIDSCYLLLFNSKSNDTIMQNSDFRKALFLSYDVFANNVSQDSANKSCAGFVPHSYFTSDGVYGENDPARSYDVQKAKSLLDGVLKTLDDNRLPEVELIYEDNPVTRDYVNRIAQNWQKNLGLYIKLTVATEDNFYVAVRDKTYQIAVTKVSSGNNTAKGMLREFSSDKFLSGYTNKNFDSLLMQNTNNSIKSAQQQLIDLCVAIPMYYTYNFYAYSKEIDVCSIDTRGNSIDLSSIR